MAVFHPQIAGYFHEMLQEAARTGKGAGLHDVAGVLKLPDFGEAELPNCLPEMPVKIMSILAATSSVVYSSGLMTQ